MKRIVLVFTVLILVMVPMLGFSQVIDKAASTQLHAMQKLVRQAKNVTVVGTHTFTYVLNGTATPVTYTDKTITFNDPLIIHNMVPLGTPDGAQYHLYMVQQGDKIAVYASQGTEEYHSYAEKIHQDELDADTMGELDSLTHGIDDMIAARLSGEETVNVNGVNILCTRIEMTAHVLDFIGELVHNTLLSNPSFDPKWSDKIEVSLAKFTMPFTYWINKATGMLVQYTYDLTDIYTGIYAFIPDKIDSGLTYTKYVHSYQVTGVNDAEEISIPAKYIAFNEH